jgi:hypothetical protein
MFVEAVLWMVRTGSPWGGLPDVFGSVEQRLSPVQPLERQACPERLPWQAVEGAFGTAFSPPWPMTATSNI